MLWHKSGAKQVPHDIPMTPTVFLHWHAGDGSLGPEQLQLCTDSFPLEDVKYLQNLVSRKIDINMRHFEFEKNNTNSYRLVTSSIPAIDAILDYMDQANPVLKFL